VAGVRCEPPCGEALVRQVKHGLAFYASETGQTPPAAWLPDSFGYSAALPTVLAGFGVRAFLTTKLSWNRVNRMPADTFRWHGVDGSEVLAHFVTSTTGAVGHPADPHAHTYNGNMTPKELAGLWAHYRGKDVNDELLYLFGYGDGGGGPTEQMVATAELLEDVPGLPQVRLGRSDSFFERLLDRVENVSLPTWSGDLTMEGHRGTYTSQARTKRANRDTEKLLREAEWANAWAVIEGLAGDRQPEIDGAWETLLRNQFHDILPGSSIAQVYVDTAAEHASAQALLRQVRDDALATFTSAEGRTSSVVSSTPWPRSQVVDRPDGQLVRVQVPAYGFAPLSSAESLANADGAPAATVTREGHGWLLDNGHVRVVVDACGEISSLVDRVTDREVVASGRSVNGLVLYEDRPLTWDAWDIDPFYADKATPLREAASIDARVVGDGLRAEVRVVRRSGDTTIEQLLILDAGARMLEVVTDVDWRERNVLLRATFPFDTGARHVTAGRPFGSVELPVHRNTSWEQARFEVVVHGWLDLSDGAGGVALLTDGTYGHGAEASTLGLSLLKSGAWPDPHADEGRHRFRYALLPHAGTWQEAGVPRAAFELGTPLRVVEGPAASSRSLLHVEGAGVVAETVKVADDGTGLVVRLIETHAAGATVRLRLERAPSSAERTDLAERSLADLTLRGHEVDVTLRPHEVVTLRLRWRPEEMTRR
jgi:alpha-mannosidase